LIKDNPIITIIIPAYNEQKYINECLKSIFHSNLGPKTFEVIVVDNGSTDGTVDIARSYNVSLYINEEANVGGVRNYGAKYAKGQILAFLDSDCVIDEGWLQRAINSVNNNIDSVFGGQYLIRQNPSWLERNWVLNDNSSSVEQTTLVGGCIVIKKDMFLKVGGFDESMLSGEDSDLTLKLRQSGYNVVIDPNLSVVHLGYPSSVPEFVRRQIWHSLDYINNFPKSMFDKVFLVTLVFLSGFFITFASVVFGYSYFFAGISLIFISTLVLSIKRLLRSDQKNCRVDKIISVVAVDFLYLLGRSLGVISGIFRLFGLHFLYFKKG
jgi:glycosyltransferase involved in cell wall biosynthesis